MRWLIIIICLLSSCEPVYAGIGNVKGAALDSVAESRVCGQDSGTFTLALISSTQKIGVASAAWEDMACDISSQQCFVGENIRSVATDGAGNLTDTFTGIRLNGHRVNIFPNFYDNDVAVLDNITHSGTPCTAAGAHTACVTPTSVEKSESLGTYYMVGGLDAESSKRGAVCLIPPNATGETSDIICLNEAFGLTIVEASATIVESTNKLFFYNPQPGTGVIYRYSLSASDITDDSFSSNVTYTGTPPSASKMIVADQDGLLYFMGPAPTVYSITQALASQTLVISSHSAGTFQSLHFDDVGSKIYVCGNTRLEQYNTSGTLTASSSNFGCRDIQVDQITGKVYSVSSAGVVRRHNATTLATEESLTLTSGSTSLGGLEVDGTNRRLYAINTGSGGDTRTFYKVRTCTN